MDKIIIAILILAVLIVILESIRDVFFDERKRKKGYIWITIIRLAHL